jgi:hypothetical protein
VLVYVLPFAGFSSVVTTIAPSLLPAIDLWQHNFLSSLHNHWTRLSHFYKKWLMF